MSFAPSTRVIWPGEDWLEWPWPRALDSTYGVDTHSAMSVHTCPHCTRGRGVTRRGHSVTLCGQRSVTSPTPQACAQSKGMLFLERKCPLHSLAECRRPGAESTPLCGHSRPRHELQPGPARSLAKSASWVHSGHIYTANILGHSDTFQPPWGPWCFLASCGHFFKVRLGPPSRGGGRALKGHPGSAHGALFCHQALQESTKARALTLTRGKRRL